MFNDLIHLLAEIPIMHFEWLKLLGEDLMPTIILLCFVTLMLIEMIREICNQSQRIRIQSYLTNIAMFVFNTSILSMLSISSLLLLAERYHHNGLLNIYNQPVQVLFSFILFDLTLYLWHRANHDYDCLWMFHKVHHSDKSMNVSTSFRVHFIEVLLTTFVKAFFIILTGVETAVVALFEGVSTLFVMFHHLNVTFRCEKWLKWFFIVPSLHRVHHSTLRTNHDSNYGAVFSLWDRMFRTFTETKPVEVGLVNVKALNFYELLKFGLFPGKSSPAPTSVPACNKTLQPEKFNAMIADAAYYKAEKRGFVPGNDFLDWFEAEQQINSAFVQSDLKLSLTS